jgi:hypothetical protein
MVYELSGVYLRRVNDGTNGVSSRRSTSSDDALSVAGFDDVNEVFVDDVSDDDDDDDEEFIVGV